MVSLIINVDTWKKPAGRSSPTSTWVIFLIHSRLCSLRIRLANTSCTGTLPHRSRYYCIIPLKKFPGTEGGCQSALVSPRVQAWWISPWSNTLLPWQEAHNGLQSSSIKWNSSKDIGRWLTAIKRPQLFQSTHTDRKKNWCPKGWGHGTACTKRSSLSNFLDNSTVGALAVMCHSSAGSSGMGGDRLYPCCPCQQLNTNISITCFVRESWGGRVGWGRRTEPVELEVQRKHNVPFSRLAGTQVHDGGSSEILSWRPLKMN